MARRYRLSNKATTGLAKIWTDIAKDNPVAADALYFRIFEKIESAAIHPNIGAPRPELGDNVRMLVEGNYKILYVPMKNGIVVTAIVHARRLPANWL